MKDIDMSLIIAITVTCFWLVVLVIAALTALALFDIVEELGYFDRELAEKAVREFGFDVSLLDNLDNKYQIMPAELVGKHSVLKIDKGGGWAD